MTKDSKTLNKKTVCNPFRYLDLYQLQKMLHESGENMLPETKEMVTEAIQEKLKEAPYNLCDLASNSN